MRMFTDNEVGYLRSEEPVLISAIGGEVELTIRELDGLVTYRTMTIEDIDDLSDALLLARAYLVNLTNQDTVPNNTKP
jgi:hypothetical protein